MSDSPSDPFPPEAPRRTFGFKPTEFDRTNRPLDGRDDTPAVDARVLCRQAAVPPAGAPPVAAPAKNEVHAMLQDNLARASEAGDYEVDLRPKRPSRRRRDYWLLLITVNLGLAGAMAFFGRNIFTLVCGGAGIVLCSVGLTWIMWFVMDDY